MSKPSASHPTTVHVGIVEDSDEDFAAVERLVRRSAPLTGIERWARAETLLAALDEDRVVWPSLFLIDLNLPGIDGVELVRRLRDHPATRGLPLFVVTGSVRVRDIERSYAAGASIVLTKPLKRDHLMAALQLASAVQFTARKAR